MTNILITGRGTSGSWQIRGVQLGRAIGATVSPNALDVGGYDLAVVVKRCARDLIARLHRGGVPIVWDIVDAWPQPHGNAWGRDPGLSWLWSQLMAIRPRAVVAATQRMASDIAELDPHLPCICLPHHARPRQAINPIRDEVITIGYEGAPHYLGRWLPEIEGLRARGVFGRWVLNPPKLADLDILLALRDCDGYVGRAWKSNVKLANAQGSGTPVIATRASGYEETASGAEIWVDSPKQLGDAIAELRTRERRQIVGEELRKHTVELTVIADRYKAWLSMLR